MSRGVSHTGGADSREEELEDAEMWESKGLEEAAAEEGVGKEEGMRKGEIGLDFCVPEINVRSR